MARRTGRGEYLVGVIDEAVIDQLVVCKNAVEQSVRHVPLLIAAEHRRVDAGVIRDGCPTGSSNSGPGNRSVQAVGSRSSAAT